MMWMLQKLHFKHLVTSVARRFSIRGVSTKCAFQVCFQFYWNAWMFLNHPWPLVVGLIRDLVYHAKKACSNVLSTSNFSSMPIFLISFDKILPCIAEHALLRCIAEHALLRWVLRLVSVAYPCRIYFLFSYTLFLSGRS